MLPPLALDPRFAEGLRLLDAGDWMEASELFEELFFECTGDEVPLVRALMQISTGLHHVSRGQRRAAVERLEVGLEALGEVTDGRGIDVGVLAGEVRRAIETIRAGGRPTVVSSRTQ